MALSELGSISLAAEKLHLSPPAIHKQLKILESELGVVLYEKVGRRLQLTQAAEVLLPYLKELLAQYDSALAALQEWKGMKRGVVRLGTGPSAYVLPAILKEFRRQNPAVEVLVETGNTPVLLDGLARGSLDLALLVSADLVEKEDYRVEMSWDFELVMISHQRLPPSNPRLAELKHLRFILFRKGSRMEEPIDRYFAANGFEPNVVMRFDNAEFIPLHGSLRHGHLAASPVGCRPRCQRAPPQHHPPGGAAAFFQDRAGPPQVRLRAPGVSARATKCRCADRRSFRLRIHRRVDAQCRPALRRRSAARYLERLAADSGLGVGRHEGVGSHHQRRSPVHDCRRWLHPRRHAARNALLSGQHRARGPCRFVADAAGGNLCVPLLVHLRQRRLGGDHGLASRDGIQHRTDSGERGERSHRNQSGVECH